MVRDLTRTGINTPPCSTSLDTDWVLRAGGNDFLFYFSFDNYNNNIPFSPLGSDLWPEYQPVQHTQQQCQIEISPVLFSCSIFAKRSHAVSLQLTHTLANSHSDCPDRRERWFFFKWCECHHHSHYSTPGLLVLA